MLKVIKSIILVCLCILFAILFQLNIVKESMLREQQQEIIQLQTKLDSTNRELVQTKYFLDKIDTLTIKAIKPLTTK